MLRSFKSGGGGWGYDPARAQVFNVFNPTDPMGLGARQPSLEAVLQAVRRACREDVQEVSCVEVTRLLWDWAQDFSEGAVEKQIPTLSIGQMASVRYWNNFAFKLDGKPTFIFLDHRRGKALTQLAKNFALSMMHQQIRVADPDFSDAQLAVLQFPHPRQGERYIRATFDDGVDLFSFDELQEMVQETYDIWRDINEERQENLPRAAGQDGWWG
jgi:hypothetical protein